METVYRLLYSLIGVQWKSYNMIAEQNLLHHFMDREQVRNINLHDEISKDSDSSQDCTIMTCIVYVLSIAPLMYTCFGFLIRYRYVKARSKIFF